MNKIVERNKLIAEFMGGIYDNHGQPNKYWEFISASKAYPQDKDLCYHKSWNWLMPVYRKCCGNLGIDNWSKSERIYNLLSTQDFTDITAIYEAIIKFIKWYNDEKNN